MRPTPAWTASICMNLSSKVSATYQAARTAADAVADRIRVEVVDSLTLTMGLGLARPRSSRSRSSSGKTSTRCVAGVEDTVVARPCVRRRRQSRLPAQRRPDRWCIAPRRFASFDQARARGQRRRRRGRLQAAHAVACDPVPGVEGHRRRTASSAWLSRTAGRPTPAKSSKLLSKRRASTRSRRSVARARRRKPRRSRFARRLLHARAQLTSSSWETVRRLAATSSTASAAQRRLCRISGTPGGGGLAGSQWPAKVAQERRGRRRDGPRPRHPAVAPCRTGGGVRPRRGLHGARALCCFSPSRRSGCSTFTPSATACGPRTRCRRDARARPAPTRGRSASPTAAKEA